MSVNAVIDYLLSKIDDEAGDSITNLKIQKLLYYCQGWHLSQFGMPLFNEELQAWPHGPVTPPAYQRLKRYGNQSVDPQAVVSDPMSDLSEESRSLIDQVWALYGWRSASELRNMTHQERPWKEAWAAGPEQNTPLDQTVMREFFDEEGRRQLEAAEPAPLPESDVPWAAGVAA